MQRADVNGNTGRMDDPLFRHAMAFAGFANPARSPLHHSPSVVSERSNRFDNRFNQLVGSRYM
jgi:hypothetical protein